MATSPASPPTEVRLGSLVLDLARRELRDATGMPAGLRHKALELLLVLGAQAGHVVSKDELMLQVWPAVVVTDDSLTQAIAEIRRCLGDTRHQWIRTVARRGYCLQADAEADVDGVAVGGDASGNAGGVPAGGPGLPLAHGPLFGREADQSAVQSAVHDARLVTLAGAGGIGKTSLALAVARGLLDWFGNAVWWVDLALARETLPLLPCVAAAVRIDLPPGDPVAALVAALRARPALLVLDNCEHRLDEVAALAAALLAGTTELHLLATSQGALQVAGERVYRLSTLECPAVGATFEQARDCPAFALLETRAREADQRFAIDAAGLPAAILLCRQLDGMALALEMAAARLPALGVQAVQRLLGERLTLLRHARRDAPARHETLQATLAWSCGLLDEADRHALYTLAVFAGTFEATMAQRLMAPQLGEAACLDTLCTLVDKALLQVEPGEVTRYRLLESMRLYALARLHDGVGEAEARLRHGRAMAEHASLLRAAHSAQTHDAVLARFGACHADFEQAFARACSRHDAEVAAETLNALRSLDQLRGDLSATERRLIAAVALLPQAHGTARARILSAVAASGWIRLSGWTARLAAEAAAEAWRALGADVAELHHALLLVATESARVGECTRAQQALDEAHTLRAGGGLARQRIQALTHAGHVAMFCGQWVHGLDCLRAALALARQSGATRLACYLLPHLASAAQLAGDHGAAQAYSASAVAESRACHAPDYLVGALLGQVDVDLAAGNLDGARSAARQALPLAVQYGLHLRVAASFAELALRRAQPVVACGLLGLARLHEEGQHAMSRHSLRQYDDLRAELEQALGAEVAARLLREGERLDAEAVFDMAAQIA